MKNYVTPGCNPTAQFADLNTHLSSFTTDLKEIVMGPASKISPEVLDLVAATYFGKTDKHSQGLSPSQQLKSAVHIIDGTLDDFNNYINNNFRNVTPGGFFLGDQPTFAYPANVDLSVATFTQSALDTVLTNISISTSFSSFSIPYLGTAGKTLQMTVYFGLAMAVYPAFFALYPTLESLRSIRKLHYSNGTKALESLYDYEVRLTCLRSQKCLPLVSICHLWLHNSCSRQCHINCHFRSCERRMVPYWILIRCSLLLWSSCDTVFLCCFYILTISACRLCYCRWRPSVSPSVEPCAPQRADSMTASCSSFTS